MKLKFKLRGKANTSVNTSSGEVRVNIPEIKSLEDAVNMLTDRLDKLTENLDERIGGLEKVIFKDFASVRTALSKICEERVESIKAEEARKKAEKGKKRDEK